MSVSPRRIALTFPGQGSQSVGMGRAMFDAFAEARSAFEAADRALGTDLSRLCFEGPEERLAQTTTTQPAILATSLAVLAALRSRAPQRWADSVVCAAGHSLGEYSALVATGSLGFEDALRIVHRRGAYMQDAVPLGQGAMAALLGAPLTDVEGLCREAAGGDVLSPANLNAPDQTVVAGSAAAVDRLVGMARGRGVRKVVRLSVSAPFHCALMRPAQEKLARDLERLPLRDAAPPVIQNVSAQPAGRAEDLREALRRQVTEPVRWVETIRCLRGMGVDTVVEVGPGRVLTGLAKRIDPHLTALHVEDPHTLELALDALGMTGGGRA